MTPLAFQVLLATLMGCGWATAEQAEVEHAIPSASATRVEVIILEESDATLELQLPGEIAGHRDAMLAAANGGYVEKVLVEAGDEVSKGQTLIRVDASLYAAQLDQAEAQFAQADAELGRVEALGDLSSASALDGARTQARVAKAAAAQARARMSRSLVRAPFDGTIADVMVEAGESAPPGGTVARLVILDPVTVVLSVADRDVVALRPDVQVRVGTSASALQYDGVISHIAPAANMKTRTFPVEVSVENPDHTLLPGMIARVEVDIPMVEDAVVIPQDWVVTRRDHRGIFVETDGFARWRDIELGAVIHDQIVVTSGLAEGDRVIITGHRDLAEGDLLLVAREGRCCAAGRPVYGE